MLQWWLCSVVGIDMHAPPEWPAVRVPGAQGEVSGEVRAIDRPRSRSPGQSLWDSDPKVPEQVEWLSPR